MVRFRVLRPGPFNSSAFLQEVRHINRLHAARIKRDFQRTVASWPEEEVEFHQKTVANRNEVSLEVYTDNEIYSWVNYGTKRHPIEAVNAKTLSFRDGPGADDGYHPATTPGVIGSTQIYEDGQLVQPRQVMHPGIEARRFDEAIFNRRAPDWEMAVQDAFNRGAEDSGHDMGPSPAGRRSPPGNRGRRVREATPGQIFQSAATIALGGAAIIGTFPGID